MDLVVSGILNFLTEQEAIGKADEVQDFYRYGIEITISSMLNIVLVLLMGALTGHLLESVIYLAVFIAVRVITGGYHADTYFRCNLLMCSTFIATAFLNDKVCGYINIWVIVALVVFEEIIAFVFCPVENKNKPIEKEKKPKFKAMGMIVFLLLDLFGGAIINKYQMVGSMILLTNLLIAVLIISAKIKEKRCDNNTNKPGNDDSTKCPQTGGSTNHIGWLTALCGVLTLIFVEGIKKERRRLPSPFGWGYMVRMWVSLAAFRKGTCWQARFQENRRWRNDPSPPIVFRLFRFRKRRLI